jgi:hypothetical protein
MIPKLQPSPPAKLSSHNHDLTNRFGYVHSFVRNFCEGDFCFPTRPTPNLHAEHGSLSDTNRLAGPLQ